jgi:hypothetical protein
VSATTTLIGDSLALDTPDQILTEARSFRHAHSTSKKDSLTADSLADWMKGDTLLAHWIQAPDSTGKQRPALHKVTGRGGAKAFTHSYPAKPDTTKPRPIVPVKPDSTRRDSLDPNRPSLDYTTADVIVVDMEKGRIQQVTAAGHVHGFHLDPLAAKDTTKARPDSAKKKP